MPTPTKLEKQLQSIIDGSTLGAEAKARLSGQLKDEGFSPRWYAAFEKEISAAQDDLFASTNLTLDPKEHPELQKALEDYADEVTTASHAYAATTEWAEKELATATTSILKAAAKTQIALAS